MMEAETIVLGKYQYVSERLMTHEEILAEIATFPFVPPAVAQFVIDEFVRIEDYIDDQVHDGNEVGDSLYGGEGRIALGYSHESVFEGLVEAWGFDVNEELTGPDQVMIDSFYDRFFTE